MEEKFDRDAVAMAVVDTLKLEEHSQVFQTLLNQELMGVEADTGKRSRGSDNTPPPQNRRRQSKG